MRSVTEVLTLMPEAVAVFCRYNIAARFRRTPFLPRSIHLIPSHRCNARCIMCGLWRDGDAAACDMSLDELDRVLADRLFSHLEYAGISGGEPFLMEDLPAVMTCVQRNSPGLKRISLTTNGLLTERIRDGIGQLVDLARQNRLLLDVSVSCHAVGPLLDRIYGVDEAFDKLSATLDVLEPYRRNGGLTFSLNCVLLNDNIEGAPALLDWACDRRVPISFVVGENRERFINDDMEGVILGPERRDELLAFLKLAEERRGRGTLDAVRYTDLISVIGGGRARTLSCYYAFAGVMLGHDGTLYYCSHSRALGNCRERSAHDIFYDPANLRYRETALLRKECLHCPPYTFTRMEREKDVLKIVKHLIAAGSRRHDDHDKCHPDNG